MTATPLVDAQWLKDHSGRAGLRVIDATWALDGGATPGRHAFAQGHIPGAVFLDIDHVCDRATDLPHMLPTPDDFARHMRELQIGRADHVVVYDQAGLFSAPRVWWMFRVFGHRHVQVLNGGLPAWRAIGGRVAPAAEETSPGPSRAAADYPVPEIDRARLADISLLQAIIRGEDDRPIIDARPANRFSGAVPEPRAGLRSGAMPNARNLPFTDLRNSEGKLADADTLRAAFAGIGFHGPERRAIATCGSGISAAMIALAHEVLGWGSIALYDGSWAEWGRPDPEGNRPVIADARPAKTTDKD